MKSIENHFLDAREILDKFLSEPDNFSKIESAGKICVESLKKSKKIISCGNGGSMCDAMHFAEELAGNYRKKRKSISAVAISDASYISCVANDFGWENIFSRYIEGIGAEGDILFVISTSGNSLNIINAAKAAKEKKMKVIGLTGKDGGKLAPLCDVEIRAPYSEYSDRTQEIHIKVIHSLIDYIETNLLQ